MIDIYNMDRRDFSHLTPLNTKEKVDCNHVNEVIIALDNVLSE